MKEVLMLHNQYVTLPSYDYESVVA